ncbi:MAG: DUF92 domain-containing protein [Gemmatimonadales bacterium]
MPWGVAALASSAAVLVAWWSRTLTASGALAAWTVGLLVLHGTGWQGGALLAAFFISSNLVSRVGPRPTTGLDPKSDRRDLWQVYANGGAAALAAVLSPPASPLGIWAVTGALAAAAADTWATSIGATSRLPPRLVWSGRTVPAGTSGGMTPAGNLGAAAGAFSVAATGAVVTGVPLLLLAGTLIGFLGMVADSALGAALQGRFHCPNCDEASEWRVHRCGASTSAKGGLSWLNNDGVNFLATALAACAALAAATWLYSA